MSGSWRESAAAAEPAEGASQEARGTGYPVEVLSRVFQPPARQFEYLGATEDPLPEAGHCVYAVYDPVAGRCTAAHTGLAHLTVIDAAGVRSVAPSTQAPIHADLCDTAEFDVRPDSLLTLSCAGLQERPRQAADDEAGADKAGSGTDSQHPARAQRPAAGAARPEGSGGEGLRRAAEGPGHAPRPSDEVTRAGMQLAGCGQPRSRTR